MDTTLWDAFLAALGEVIGTAILVFLGCAGCMAPPLHVAFTFGLAIMVAIQCVDHISGAHLNPAVTVAAVILGNKSLPIAGLYAVAQCLGGLIGFGLLKAIMPLEFLPPNVGDKPSEFCTTQLTKPVTSAEGFATELLATAILVFFACAAWDPNNKKNTDTISLKFGLCVTVLCLSLSPFTGCSLNPARSLAPAVWNGFWDNHWVYWIGPLLGGIISATLYRCMFWKNSEKCTQDASSLHGIET